MHIIGGKHKKRRLLSPKTEMVRPTSGQLREAVFNICQLQIEDSQFLDLFAGSGAMGLEALSRGATHATFVEKDRKTALLLKQNISTLHEDEHSEVYILDALEALKKFVSHNKTFDIIFADPPYGTAQFSQSNLVLDFVDRHPILSDHGILFLEDSMQASSIDPQIRNLTLISKRKMGPATLREFHKK